MPRKNIKWILFVAAMLMLSHSFQVQGSKKEDQSRIKVLINSTRQKILQNKKKEQYTLSTLTKHQQELETLQQNYQVVSDKLDGTQKKVVQSKLQLSNLQQNLVSLESDLESRHELLGKRLVAIYKYGPLTYLRLIMSSGNFGDLISNFDSVAYFVRSDLQMIDAFENSKTRVNEQKQQVAEHKAVVEAELHQITILQNQVSQQKQKVSEKVASTKDELVAIQSDRTRLEKALDEYEATSRQLEAQIRQEQQRSKSKVLGTGQFNWPVHGRITSPFGWRFHPILKQNKFHNGIDISVPSGTTVLAADSGVVLVSSWQGGYGNYVAIDHGKGISTGYGHNSRLLVRVGQQVTKGQPISISGSTGLSTGPHVHFEVRVNGNPTNPFKFL